MRKILGLMIVITVSMMGGADFVNAQSRSRVDLDDLMIKGEIHNDDRLMILSRQKNEMKNYIKFRTSYRDEILQELPVSVKKVY